MGDFAECFAGETRAARKQVFDKKHRVREQIIQTGDQVLIKQQKM